MKLKKQKKHKLSKSSGKSPSAEDEEKSLPGKKRRRPWRQAIRHRAKRERRELVEKEDGPGEEEEEEGKQSEEGEEAVQAKVKKPKTSRRKRLRRKRRIMATEGSEAGAELQQQEKENAEGQGEEKNPLTRRLDASRFRYLNEQLYTQPSTSAVELFKQDPKAFAIYHKGYREQLKKWPTNPLQVLLLDLSTLPKGSVVADLGCGEAELARRLGSANGNFTVHSFDLVAANERVTAADMAHLPLGKSSVDVCVYCLSLMGTNLAQFFREAHRVLKMGGKLKIAEVASRFQNVKAFLSALAKMGFQLKRKKEIGDGFFLLLTLQKVGKIENKRPEGLRLMPCLYKKR